MMMKFFAGIAITLVIVAAMAVAYFAGKGQPSANPSPQATTVTQTVSDDLSSPKASAAPSSLSDFVNPSATIAAIEEAVTKKDYKSLSSYMNSSISVILYASECCGSITKAEAIEQLKYLNGATPPWNFDDSNPIAAKLNAMGPEYFKDNVIGTSANKYAVGFGLDDKYLIKSIVMVANYELITSP